MDNIQTETVKLKFNCGGIAETHIEEQLKLF